MSHARASRLASVAIGVLGVFLAWGCGLTAGETDTTRAHLVGGDTRIATFETSLPARAVGRVDVAFLKSDGKVYGTSCTGSAIERNVVLFASHCLCDVFATGLPYMASQWSFHLPYAKDGRAIEPGPVAGVEYEIGKGGVPAQALDYWMHPKKCDDDRPETSNRADLAIIVLARALTTEELPQTMPIYTAGDFTDRIFNLHGGSYDPTFFQGPRELVGFADPDGALIKRAGSLLGGQKLNFDASCGFFGGGCGPYFVTTTQNGTHVEHGDSGGPLTFRQFGVTPTQFAVSASMFTYSGVESWFTDDKDVWSPTWDTGYGNGEFIRKYLVDADGDGVLDPFDNCPPSRCGASMDACKNPDQTDLDGDGVGDSCDNCKPTLCAKRGLADAACANPAQNDLDKDGVGDSCDLCPATSDFGFQLADADGDGIGDRCDHCVSIKGELPACTSDADCVERTPSGIATGVVGTCLRDGPGEGRCSIQLDDADHDKLGIACDTCPRVANAEVQVNSNTHREAATSSLPMGDRCDAVPLYTLAPVIVPVKPGDTVAKKKTIFVGAAGIGSNSPTPSVSVRANVDFKYCSCITDDGHELDFDACRAGPCAVGPSGMDASHWTAIDLTSESEKDFVFRGRMSRSFTDTVDCSDASFHPENPDGSPVEACHVGHTEALTWMHEADAAAGRIRSIAGDFTRTTGIVWSETGSSFASTRDSGTFGALRSSFVYLKTPLTSTKIQIDLALPADYFDRVPIFRPDYGGGGIFGGGDPGPDDGPGWRSGPSWIVSTGQTLLSTSDQGSLDVTSAFSPTARALFAAASGSAGIDGQGASMRFYTPTGTSARSGIGDVAMVGMPTSWKQSYGGPLAVVRGANGFVLEAEAVANVQNAPNDFALQASVPLSSNDPFAGTFVPGDREGAVAVVSAREQAMYLVGGVRDGVPTGQVWRYTFGARTWEHLFVGGRLPATSQEEIVQPGNVLSVAYGDREGKLLVLDEVAMRVSQAPLASQRRLRLLSLDVRAQKGVVLASLAPGKSVMQRGREIVALEDQTFVWLSQLHTGPGAHHVIQRFGVTPRGLVWLGFVVRPGTLTRGAYANAQGVVVPVIGTGSDARASFADVPLTSLHGARHASIDDDLETDLQQRN